MYVLLYDADCAFCRWVADRVVSYEGRKRLVPLALQHPGANALLGPLSAARRMSSWHLVSPDGRVHSAGAGVAPLLRLLRGFGVFAPLADALPQTTSRLYDALASRRNRFGRWLRLEACPAP